MPGEGRRKARDEASGLNANGAAILGLLAIRSWPRPWTTYELTKQSHRSLRWFWPRAERLLYDTPKKLVELGFATASVHHTGKRPSTLYAITPAGRRALRAWLDEEGKEPLFEFEQLIRVFFAEQGTKSQLQTTLARIQRQALDSQRQLADIVRAMPQPFAGDRAAVNALSIKLITELHRTTAEWAAWAHETVAEWDSPREHWDGATEIFTAIIEEDDGRAHQDARPLSRR